MFRRRVRKRKIFNPFLRTSSLEFKLRWKKILLFSIILVVFTLLISFFYPYQYDENQFFRAETMYFRYLILFISCFLFSDIVCSEFSLKTGYIMFPKINKYKLIAGKYIANLCIIILLVILHYITLNITIIVIYDTVIPESFISLGIAIMYTITLSAIILLFSTIIPKVNLTTIVVILLFLVGFSILEQVTTVINQELEPILSLNFIGNLIEYVIPGGLPIGRRWNWVYYAGDTLPPVKLWLTPTIEMGILIMSLYIVFSFLCTYLVLGRKEL